MSGAEVPNTLGKLNAAVARVAQDRSLPEARVRMLICSVILSQMLPEPTLVKGGIGVKLRLGERGTRATTDFDVATPLDQSSFQASLDARLNEGWGSVPPSKGALRKDPDASGQVAFTGRSRLLRQPTPDGVPPAYLMVPYRVTLQFMGRDWGGITLEVGHDELDGTNEAAPRMATELTDLAGELGFGDVRPVPLIAAEHQLAQKSTRSPNRAPSAPTTWWTFSFCGTRT